MSRIIGARPEQSGIDAKRVTGQLEEAVKVLDPHIARGLVYHSRGEGVEHCRAANILRLDLTVLRVQNIEKVEAAAEEYLLKMPRRAQIGRVAFLLTCRRPNMNENYSYLNE
jgi:hypothetical protein